MIGDDTKKIVVTLSICIVLIVAIPFTIGLISNLHINSGGSTARSDQGLICYVTIDQTNTVNVTWYRNGVKNTTANISCNSNVECSTTPTSGNVPNNFTKRDDIWTCNMAFYNGSGTESSSINVTIVDSPPSQPQIFWSNGTQIVNTTAFISEDNTTVFNVTSIDFDNDAITYNINDTTFCNIGGSTGVLTCSPNQQSHVGVRTIRVGADTTLAATYQFLTINVTPNNAPPYFSPNLTNQNLTEGQVFNYLISGADRENNVPFNATIASVNPALSLNLTRINSTAFMLMLDTNRTATFSEAGQNYTVTLNIMDTDNITSSSKNTSASFIAVGTRHNHLPNVSYVVYNNGSLIQGGNLSIYINASDIDNDTLTFSTSSALYPITYNSSMNYTIIQNASFRYAFINLTSLSNNYVTTPNFTLYVFDTKENFTQAINLFVNNINDPPVIYDISNNPINTLNNVNITNLTAYTGVLFRYQVNASDPDDLTYDAANTGLGTYNTSDTNFPINSTTGLLYFTPTTAGNYTFIVNATDKSGLSYNKTANITIRVNSNPSFAIQPMIVYCNETDGTNWPFNCYYNVSAKVNDTDAGDYVANYWTNSTMFQINSTTGIINFTANQSFVGNNSIILNITDTRGGTNSTTMYMIINNTNNPPNIGVPNMPSGNLIVGQAYQITFNANDLDLSLPNTYENLNFTENITGPTTGIFSVAKISATQAAITINPINSSSAGNYTLNVTVTDFYNNKSQYNIVGLFIYNITSPPNIKQVIPSGTPLNSTINNESFINTSNFPGMATNITINENTSYIFNQISTADNSSYPNFLNYSWYYDNSLVSTSSSYPKSFDFFTSGLHNLTFIASDQYQSNNSFNWLITINNANRPPIYYNNSLENLTIAGTISIADYLAYRNNIPRFYDPDDDPANKGYSLGNETTLQFSSTQCPYANFSFQNATLNIKTIAVGMCNVIFTATDALNSSMFVSSQVVSINITNITQDANTTTPIQVNTLTSGGGTNTQPLPIPLPQEVEKPRPLQLITPNLVTVYKNATVKIPLIVNNTWNSTLYGITLRAETNASNVTLSLDRTFIAQLDTGQSVDATLLVQNYKSEGHYEIQVVADVGNPQYTDTATILINSAEMNSEGDALESKISFAKDLLSSNPECQELNELLIQAEKELSNNNYAGTAKLVDSVINGCKYLVNNAKPEVQKPNQNFIKTFEWKSDYNSYAIIGIFSVLFFISLYYVFKKEVPEQSF